MSAVLASQPTTAAPKKYRLKGINADHDTCSACGKRGLKKVVWMVELNDVGDEISEANAYGADCAAKMLGWGFGTRAKQERRVEERAYADMRERIGEAVRLVWKDWILFRYTVVTPPQYEWQQPKYDHSNVMLPRDLYVQAQDGAISPQEARRLVREREPILAHNDATTMAELLAAMPVADETIRRLKPAAIPAA